ncbi:hypothetical protein DyAD56_21300 [Dyella sp. AD56]|nr:hypothetical protein DyAD56_21300 [Dyella sp. AD56]
MKAKPPIGDLRKCQVSCLYAALRAPSVRYGVINTSGHSTRQIASYSFRSGISFV